jgi:hypothetical protein
MVLTMPARPGLVAGKRFAGVKRGGSHLFLRYAFSSVA